MATYVSHYPPAYSSTYVKATTSYSYTPAYHATDPSNSLIGVQDDNGWSCNGASGSQKFNIDHGEAFVARRIYYENSHISGNFTDRGIRYVYIYGTNSDTAFANTTYADTTDLTLLWEGELTKHVASNVADPQYIDLSSNTTAYRYTILRISTSWGDTYMGIRRIEVQEDSEYGADPVPVMASLDQSWVLFDSHLVAALSQDWHLLEGIVQGAMEQLWGLRLGADLVQSWADAPVIKGRLSQPWGNAGVIKGKLVQRWRDMVTLRARLDQPWAVMESLLVALEQPWAITSGPVQALLDQGWDIKDITPVLAVLNQPWSLASDGTVLRYTVEVLADGNPVRVSHINIEGGLDESDDVLTCEIHLETEWEYLLCPFGAELTISITCQEGTDSFVFVVTSPRINEEHGSTSYVVEAMSPAALLGAPYAEGIEGELSGLVSEIAATLAGDLTISWDVVDWNIPPATWIASGETPLALLKTLAAAVGAVVQSDPDGTVAVRPRYPVAVPRWATATPDLVLTETLDCFSTGSTPDHRYGYNRFLVSNQSSSAAGLTLEEETISGMLKEVRGYQVPWDGLFALTHTGGSWVVIEPMGIDTREETETVEFVAGAGSTRYPIYGLVSVEWQQTNLGTITTAEDGGLTAAVVGQSLCEITYTTKCRLWRVTDQRGEQLQLVAEI